MDSKKILFITHQLSRTGAPIVLLDMIRLAASKGHEITVISLMEGELSEELCNMGISVTIKDDFWHDRENFSKYASGFSLVVANTLVTYQVIHALAGSVTPVLWWLHEGEQYFEYFKQVLPDFAHLPSNIHTVCVSSYVSRVIEKRYGVTLPLLPFCVKRMDDAEIDPDNSDPWLTHFTSAPVRFLICGTYSMVKGQDLAAAAIRELPKDIFMRCRFIFCGNEEMYDPKILNPVRALSKTFPDQVKMIASVPRAEVLLLMKYGDFLLIPSRIDPMPTVAVEAMMMGRINIITDVCGAAGYLEDGRSGILIPPDDAASIGYAIKNAVLLCDDIEGYSLMAHASKKIYENNFSEGIVKNLMLSVIEGLFV